MNSIQTQDLNLDAEALELFAAHLESNEGAEATSVCNVGHNSNNDNA